MPERCRLESLQTTSQWNHQVQDSFIRRVRGRLMHGLLLQEVLDRVAKLGLVIYPYRVYVKHLGETDAPDNEKFSGYTFRELSVADVPAMHNILIKDVPIDHLRQRFDRGDLCHGVFYEDSLVGYTCGSRDVCYGGMRSVLFSLAADEAYGYSTFIRRSSRGMGLHEFMMQNCFAVLRSIGVRKQYGIVSSFNRSARKAVEKIGYTAVDQRLFIRFFGMFESNPRMGARNHFERQ
jgi:hypothetical protein